MCTLSVLAGGKACGIFVSSGGHWGGSAPCPGHQAGVLKWSLEWQAPVGEVASLARIGSQASPRWS